MPAILFEDEHFIVFNKPAGLPVIPDRWDRSLPNLLDIVRFNRSLSHANIHRIDRDTSGICMFGKSRTAIRLATRLWMDRLIGKKYLALAYCGHPVPPEGVINFPLLLVQARRVKMIVSERGKPAETQYRVLARFDRRYCLFQMVPVTGRMHQIRVHLAALGCPLIGDPIYGTGRGLYLSEFKQSFKPGRRKERPLIHRTALHADELTFVHPFSGQKLLISAPVPKDFETALNQLRKNCPGGFSAVPQDSR